MTGAAGSVSPQLARVPLLGETRAGLIGLGLPEPVADSWARHVHPLLRTVLVLRGPDGLLGAAFVVRRALGRYVKLVGFWVCEAADAEIVRASLLDELERFAWSSGAVVIKHELAEPGALDVLLAAHPGRGLVPVATPTMAGPIPDVIDHVPAAAFHWRRPRAAMSVPYVRQTTDFTCGPAAVLMALGGLGLHPALTRDSELSLWREATQVEACDPYGLALAAATRGALVDMSITTDDFVLLEGFANEQARELRRFIQRDFRKRAKAIGVSVAVRTFTGADVRRELEAGRIVLLLVDEKLFHGETCPHWIVVHGIIDELFLIHDPWTEVMAGETWLDGYDLALSVADLERVARFGDPSYGAMLALAVA